MGAAEAVDMSVFRKTVQAVSSKMFAKEDTAPIAKPSAKAPETAEKIKAKTETAKGGDVLAQISSNNILKKHKREMADADAEAEARIRLIKEKAKPAKVAKRTEAASAAMEPSKDKKPKGISLDISKQLLQRRTGVSGLSEKAAKADMGADHHMVKPKNVSREKIKVPAGLAAKLGAVNASKSIGEMPGIKLSVA